MIIKIISMNQVVFSGTADQVSIPGKSGKIEILLDHADAIFSLKEGFIRVDGRIVQAFGGFCKVIKNDVVILLE